MKKAALLGAIITILTSYNSNASPQTISMAKVLEDIEQKIITIKQGIEDNKAEFGIKRINTLKKASRAFDELTFDTDSWKAFNHQCKDKYNIVFWHHESPKNLLGAALFYPSGKVEEYSFSSYSTHLLERNDMLWSFAIAAKYGDPRGKYFLASTLTRIWDNYYDDEDEDLPSYYKALANDAEKALLNNSSSPDALYLLALDYSRYSSFPLFGMNLEKAEKFFKEVINLSQSDFQKNMSELSILRMKSDYRGHYESQSAPEFEEYVELATRNNFGKAIEQAHTIKSKDHNGKNEDYLFNAGKTYPAAFLRLGIMKQIQGHHKEAEKLFEEAAYKGISYGYIKLGILKSGMDIQKKDTEKVVAHFINLQDDTFQYARDVFLKAARKGDVMGWEYLATLHNALYALKNDNKHNDYFKEAVKGALDLGSHKAYSWLEDIYDEREIQALQQIYGDAPQKDLWKTFSNFINKIN